MLSYNDILEINSLPKDKLLKFIETLDINQQTYILRTLMPAKITPILQPKRFKFAHGGRWGSKTMSYGKALLHKADNERCRILCTREIQNTLEESVYAELVELIEVLKYGNFKATENKIVNKKTQSEFIFKGLQLQTKKQTVKSLANIKYCWVEESQTVSKESLDILVPTIRKIGSELWFSYNLTFADNPVELLRNSIPDEEKLDINILAFDNIFNSQETLKDIERLKRQYEAGENQDYLHVVLGQPITMSDFVVFRIDEIENAINRAISDEGQIVVGIDLARMGGDKTIFIKRKGLKMIDYKMFPQMKGDVLLNEIIRFVNNDTSVRINIDETGIAGGYIMDWLVSKGFKKTTSINFGKSAKEPDKYNNAISEMWCELKDKINDVQLMNIPELKSQLITREYKYDNKERKCIEPKDAYKKRGYKSPDFADAVLLCYYDTMSNISNVYFDY
jgi:phage terminase large subunit